MTLRYPMQSGGMDSDYMQFVPMPYRSNARGGPGQAGAGGAGAPAGSGAQSVILYMPNSTPSAANEQDWNSSGNSFEGPLGAAKRDVGMMIAEGVMDVGTGNNSDIVDRMKSKFDSHSKQGGGIAKQFALNQIQSFLPGTPSQMLALSKGQVYNPNVELLYSAPKLRPFSFSFDMVPKNAQEAMMVNQIILNFKKWSSPQPTGGMFEVPHVWQVSYRSGQGVNKNMNQWKKAALTSIGVQANPQTDMHVAHAGGVPVITSIQLTFQEVDIITREDHERVGGQGF